MFFRLLYFSGYLATKCMSLNNWCRNDDVEHVEWYRTRPFLLIEILLSLNIILLWLF